MTGLHLNTDGFLNEERFARAFAGGKFRMKKWGRIKISHALEAKGVFGMVSREAGLVLNNDRKRLKERLTAELRNTRLGRNKPTLNAQG